MVLGKEEEQQRDCGAVEDVAAAADIICSLRGADLAGWTPPWKRGGREASGATERVKEEEDGMVAAWPAVARGKRSRLRSPSGSAAKGRWARGSPASPLDYSGGSGASTSGGEDGNAFSSPPMPQAVANRRATAGLTPTPAALPPTKVAGSSAGSAGLCPTTTTTVMPVPPPRLAGQRSRKKMRLPEVQQVVRSLTVENVGLREEMESLRRACMELSKENGELEKRVELSSRKRKGDDGRSEEQWPTTAKLAAAAAAAQDGRSGFVLPDLNVPAEDDAAAVD